MCQSMAPGLVMKRLQSSGQPQQIEPYESQQHQRRSKPDFNSTDWICVHHADRQVEDPVSRIF